MVVEIQYFIIVFIKSSGNDVKECILVLSLYNTTVP